LPQFSYFAIFFHTCVFHTPPVLGKHQGRIHLEITKRPSKAAFVYSYTEVNRMPSLSTDPAHPSTPRIDRLREARPVLRQAGSAVLNTCEFLSGRDLITATYLIDAADRLLKRFAKLERRAA
jgi:hypothetical protein